MLMLYIF
ncbi:UDP-2,3-diacylglucosamine hydrolase, partial [Yersinia pestis PY-16]